MSLALTPNQTLECLAMASTSRRCLVSEVNCPVISCCLATLIPNTCSASSRVAAPHKAGRRRAMRAASGV